MSFSVELWDGYDLVYNTFNLHRRGLKDFIFMLTEKYNYEYDNANGMKKIYETSYAVTNMPSLKNGILAFKNDLFNQYTYSIDFLNSLKEEIIEPLKTILNHQTTKGKFFNNEYRKVEKDFKDIVDKLEKSRIKFHNCAKNAEESKVQTELAKLSFTIPKEQKSKLEIKSQNLLKEAKEAEKIYISNISNANNIRELYIDTMKKMLNEFQSLEEKLIEAVKDCLRKYVIYQVAMIRNLQYDIERKASVMEAINIQSDIRDFIENNSTNAILQHKFEFIPYVSEIDSRSNVESFKYPKDILFNIKNFISNVFHKENQESEPDSIESKNNNEIEVIVSFAWQGKELPDKENQIFIKFIRERKYRRFFLNCLNKFRVSGLFTLENNSFPIVGELLCKCLDEIIIDKDYQSAKNCMNFAQTLYKTDSEPNKPRIFLQTYLESHSIWKSIEFWEEFIKYVINEEIPHQKNYNLYSFESSRSKSKRIRSIVVTQLISFSYNMLSFQVPKDKVKETILYFCKYYDIEQAQIDEIVKNFEEYSNINEVFKENESSEIAINRTKSSPINYDSSLSENGENTDIYLTEKNNNSNISIDKDKINFK